MSDRATAYFLNALADKLDGWASQSRNGGWSTHQVAANIDAANDCRRWAAGLGQSEAVRPIVAGDRVRRTYGAALCGHVLEIKNGFCRISWGASPDAGTRIWHEATDLVRVS
jgi:hypothetical protein